MPAKCFGTVASASDDIIETLTWLLVLLSTTELPLAWVTSVALHFAVSFPSFLLLSSTILSPSFYGYMSFQD